jgi:hypothetical protein
VLESLPTPRTSSVCGVSSAAATTVIRPRPVLPLELVPIRRSRDRLLHEDDAPPGAAPETEEQHEREDGQLEDEPRARGRVSAAEEPDRVPPPRRPDTHGDRDPRPHGEPRVSGCPERFGEHVRGGVEELQAVESTSIRPPRGRQDLRAGGSRANAERTRHGAAK